MDPLTWSYVKIIACHLLQLPAPGQASGDMFYRLHGRVITRVQMVGWVSSMQHKADRTEYLLDDGSGEVPFVWWHTGAVPCRLGDLVHIFGRLKPSWTASVEITLTKVVVLTDPNIEMLHWAQAQVLYDQFYSQPSDSALYIDPSRQRTNESSLQNFYRHVFLGLPLPTVSTDSTDAVAIAIVRHLVAGMCAEPKALDTIEIEHDQSRLAVCRFRDMVKGETVPTPNEPAARLSHLRKAFASLRRAGIVYLQDDDEDTYGLLRFEHSVWPLVVQLLKDGQARRRSDVVAAIVGHPSCRQVPLDWIAQGLDGCVQAQTLTDVDDHVALRPRDAHAPQVP
ncbi:hypothetical protein ACHHYP_04680 [Achlya hypogyna]|uniref:CST complex subunit STN1 n=1 Tax=Achlya hypogyna TaxID=1202772 RepID=A0A1V9Z0D0_ACHHY|nr:hypothetical protein ACHHYP_04680 [Achlya hypogyna]